VGNEDVKTGKAARTLQSWAGPWDSRRSRLPEFLDNQHLKEVRLSALSQATYPSEDIPGNLFCYRPSRLQVHSAAGMIKSMKSMKTGRYFKNTAEKRASYIIKPQDEAGMIRESTGNVAL
jgi:hypothetical protein